MKIPTVPELMIAHLAVAGIVLADSGGVSKVKCASSPEDVYRLYLDSADLYEPEAWSVQYTPYTGAVLCRVGGLECIRTDGETWTLATACERVVAWETMLADADQ